jgi:type I restriction enzyme, S subunit
MSGAQAPEASNLPPGWEYPRLVEIARVNPARNTAMSDEDQVNFVPMRAVAPEGGGLVDPEIRLYREVKKGYTSFHAGDVIAAKITPCMENGKTAVVPALPIPGFFGSTEFHVIRPEKGIDPRWLSRFLLQQTIRRVAQRAMSGAVGQMRVPASFIENLRVPLPPSAEQNRAADTIDELSSDLDAGVAALERARTKLEKYRASVLKAAVAGALTAKWRRENPNVEPASELLKRILVERQRRWEEDQLRRFKEKGHALPKNWSARYKEPVAPDTANLPRLPDGWCWASLDQLSAIAGGVTKGQKFRDTDNTRVVPYLRVANVQRGYLDLGEIKTIRALESDIQALRLKPGDVLFNEGGDRDKLGRGWIWEGQINECIHQNHVFRARLFSHEIQGKLVSWSGNSYGQRWFMREGRQSVNLASINMTILRSFPVPLAPTEEQEVIVDAVEDQFSVLDHVEKDLAMKLESTAALRQSILLDAFAGKLVPQDPSDEPASELLKRVATQRDAQTFSDGNEKSRPSRVVRAKIRNSGAASPIASRED